MSNLASGVPQQLVTFCKEKYDLKEFLETGSYKGDSVAFAITLFDYCLTIEVDEGNWQATQNRFNIFPTDAIAELECWHGDSATLMPGALKQLDGRALIWLDAHCVAGQFGDEDSCPLLQELNAICAVETKHIILIDDAHAYMPPLPHHLTPEAWPTLEDIESIVHKSGYYIHIASDIIILAPSDEMPDIIDFLATLPSTRNAFARRLQCNAEGINGPMKKGAVPAVLPAFTGLVWTAYGWVLMHRFDTSQSQSLSHTGLSRDHADIEYLESFLRAAGFGAVFVDIGANIGLYSFGLRRLCEKVYAFEPQRIIYNMMCGSIALNGWENVFCYNVALGEKEGLVEIPQFDYNKSLSFGSVEFGLEQKEVLTQARQHNMMRREFVPVHTLDNNYNISRIDVLKIDVEGWELDVLAGAKETITRCRPVILIEWLKTDKMLLRATLESFNYVVEERGIDYIALPLP